MSEAHETLHPDVDLLADLQAGEGAETPDGVLALSHLGGCPECQKAVAPLASVGMLLQQAKVAGPSELEWARMAQRARQQAPTAARTPSKAATVVRMSSWRLVAAAAIVAAVIPATLAWLLPPCRDGTLNGDMLAMATEDPGL